MLLRPVLVGPTVTVRPGTADDVAPLLAVRSEPSVSRWWGDLDPADQTAAELLDENVADGDTVLLVIEVDGAVAGGVQYSEETTPQYRHAWIDIFVGARWQNRGVGGEAVRLVAAFLFAERDHHRLTIDPAVGNERAIRCYTRVGFRPVGVMRRCELAPDGSWRDGLLMDLLREELDQGAPSSA